MRPIQFIVLFICGLLILTGCSGGATEPVGVPDMPEVKGVESPPVETDSQRVLWGIWNLAFDPVAMQIVIEPVRNLEAHFNITPMIIPPACDDCIEIAVNSFDPVTRILDVDVTLRNPYSINGYDVRGILYTNDYGHLLENADDWTKLFETPGGESLNPFKAFAKGYGSRIFQAGAEHTSNYLVYIPAPPNYWAITYAVTASWPGNCREPYRIYNFNIDGELYDTPDSSADASITVLDWQYDVNAVTLVAPEITGQPFTAFTQASGSDWELELVNEMEAPFGEYTCRIIATSENSGDTALYDFVTIEIFAVTGPVILSIDPDSGEGGETLTDVVITGENFTAPAQVILQEIEKDDIVATNVEVIDPFTINCDIELPFYGDFFDAYDVRVINGEAEVGIGYELFTLLKPTPVVTGILPESIETGLPLSGVEIYGSKFYDLLPTSVRFKMTGEDDVVAENVNIVNSGLIECDILITSGHKPGYYDGEVTNGLGEVGVGEDMLEVTTTYKPGWARTWWDNNDDPWAYAVAAHGLSVYVCGYDSGDVAFLRKYYTTGDFLWEALIGGYNKIPRIHDMATDDSGNIYLVGSFSSSVDFDPGPETETRDAVGFYDAYLLSLGADASFRFVQTWGSTGDDRAKSIVCHGDKVYVTEYFEDTADFDPAAGERLRTSNGETDVFISRFTTAGLFEWAETWGGTLEDEGTDIAVTSANIVYVAGLFRDVVDFRWGPGEDNRSSNGITDAFLVAISGDDYFFVKAWGGTSYDRIFDLAVSTTDYLFVVGEFFGTDVDFDPSPEYALFSSHGGSDAFVNIFNGLPPCFYIDTLAWGGSGYDRAGSIAADEDGIYVAGQFSETVDFDPWGGYEPYTSAGNFDVFLSHFASDYWHQWTRVWGGTSNDYGIGVAVDSSGSSYICGGFSNLIDFDPGPGEDWHDGYQDAFLSKFPPDGNW